MSKLFVAVIVFFSSMLSMTAWGGVSDNSEALLAKLSNASGLSGFERPVRNLFATYLDKLEVSYEIDGIGNLIVKGPDFDREKPTILVMAHLDEVGFLVKTVDEKGFITALPIGGWVDHVLGDGKWRIYNDEHAIEAVTGIDPPHILTDFTKAPDFNKDQLFFDTGLTKQQLSRLGIKPGVAIVPEVKFHRLNKTDLVVGKAFDDRAGIAIMLELIADLANKSLKNPDVNIVFAATVQEEVGMRGAKVITGTVQPDVILNLESSLAGDYPRQFTQQKGTELGKGPSLFFYDNSMLPSPRLIETLTKIAQKNDIPLQNEYAISYGQDASSVQMSGVGAQAVNIGIPVRYVHSHYGIMDMNDYRETKSLLEAALSVLDRKKIEAMR